MEDLRNSFNVKKTTRQQDFGLWIQKNKKIFLYIIIVFIIINIFFNPVHTAITMSNWINDFIGTFIKNIHIK